MKVAYVCADTGVPVFGNKGCSIHVQEIVRAFLQRGAEVDLFVARVGGNRPIDMADCGVHEFPLGRRDSPGDREASQQLLSQLIARSIPMDQYDLIYERCSLWSDATQVLAARCGVASVLEVNAPLIDEQQSHRELSDRATAEQIALQAFRHAQCIAAVSEEVAQYVRSFYSEKTGNLLSGVEVVPNGVNVNRFCPDTQPVGASDRFTVGFAGSLKPWHGVESLIAAFQLLLETHPLSRLKIIGDGPLRASLEGSLQLRSSAVAAGTEFVGSVAPDRMPGHLVSLDVAVAPYVKQDQFYFSPLKVYEYMACGLPTVAADAGLLSGLISNGVNGLLYEPGNVEQLSRILATLADSPSLRRLLGTAARSKVVNEHSWQLCLDRILNHVASTTG
ncbi:MAG: glycosyltransferase family 4 protein [Planctomycetaceae bacterium]|nr:glycosyltransferase family 4 protein [Planctomycetaceae bacterium]